MVKTSEHRTLGSHIGRAESQEHAHRQGGASWHQLDPVLKALGFNSLKVQCFQAVGFKYIPTRNTPPYKAEEHALRPHAVLRLDELNVDHVVRPVQTDPGLKPSPVSNFDCGWKVAVLST